MRKKNFKGRCEKRVLGKCAEVCHTYDPIQYAYADLLQASDEIVEIKCNVLLEGLEVGEYTSDFVCTKANGDLMVRECVFRKFLMKPLTVKLLDASRNYWLTHGVTDWGLVIDEEVILSRLVDTFSSRILYPMQLLSGSHSIVGVLSWEEDHH